LPPGRYRIQGLVGQRRGYWSEPIALVPRETRDIGSLLMPVSGAIHVRVRGADGKPLPAGDAAPGRELRLGRDRVESAQIVDGEVRRRRRAVAPKVGRSACTAAASALDLGRRLARHDADARSHGPRPRSGVVRSFLSRTTRRGHGDVSRYPSGQAVR